MKWILPLFLFLSFCSCRKSHEHSEMERNLLRLSNRESLNDNIYLVIGLQGCGACLDHTVKFVNENIKNEQLVFIISEKSQPEINALFGNKVKLSENFIIDSTMMAYSTNVLGSGFPKVFICKDDKVIESYEVSYTDAEKKFEDIKTLVSIQNP